MTNMYALWLIMTLSTSCVVAQAEFPIHLLTETPDSLKTWHLRERGDSLIRKGEFRGAKKAYEEALTLAQTLDSPKEIGMGYRCLGYWHKTIGDYSQAISWYQQAQRTFKESRNQLLYAETLSYISNCFQRLHDDRQAMTYLKESIDLAEKGKYLDLLMENYQSLAIFETTDKQYDKALAHRQTVLAYYKAQKDTLLYYSALFNIALLYKNMGQFVRSERAFRQVLAYAQTQRGNVDQMIGYVYASLPSALIPQNKLDEAEAYCRRALAWVDQTGTEKHTFREEIYGHLTQIWEKRGNYQQALQAYRQQVSNHDSIFNATQSQQVAELEMRYQAQQKEAQIDRLDEVNAFQRRQIWMGITCSVILLVLMGVLGLFYMRVQRSRSKIQYQSEQLALMMKELNHRAKNNLAIISSLLYLQTTHLDDDDVIQELRVGQQRVEAMSLIHQRLYQTEQSVTVDVHDYLSDLANGLRQAYGYNASSFDLVLDVERIQLNVDIAIPLGLMANELITNAFKYAYRDVYRPSLRIGLHLRHGVLTPGIVLEVQDNGPGIEAADWEEAERRNSFGKQLITMLSQQLDGKFTFSNQNGTFFQLFIPQARLGV